MRTDDQPDGGLAEIGAGFRRLHGLNKVVSGSKRAGETLLFTMERGFDRAWLAQCGNLSASKGTSV